MHVHGNLLVDGNRRSIPGSISILDSDRRPSSIRVVPNNNGLRMHRGYPDGKRMTPHYRHIHAHIRRHTTRHLRKAVPKRCMDCGICTQQATTTTKRTQVRFFFHKRRGFPECGDFKCRSCASFAVLIRLPCTLPPSSPPLRKHSGNDSQTTRLCKASSIPFSIFSTSLACPHSLPTSQCPSAMANDVYYSLGQLEMEFQKTDADLTHMAHILDAQFHEKFDGTALPLAANPLTLLSRLHRLVSDVSGMSLVSAHSPGKRAQGRTRSTSFAD